MSTPIVYFREPGQFKANNTKTMTEPIIGISPASPTLLNNFSNKIFDLNNSWITDRYICPAILNGIQQRILIESIEISQTLPAVGSQSYTFIIQIRRNGTVIATSPVSSTGQVITSGISSDSAYIASFYVDTSLNTNDEITFTCYLNGSNASGRVSMLPGGVVSNVIL